jgi:hypothetical protein
MAEIVGSLFGITADQYERNLAAEDEKRAIQMANLAPGARGAAMIQTGAAGLGRGIGRLLGAQDPQLQLISARNQAARQIDPSNPESFMRAAQMLAQMGDTQGATALADAGRKAQAELALVGQRNAAAQASVAQATREREPRAAPTTNDLTNARAIAALAGPEGSPEYNAAFSKEYARLTTKEVKEAKGPGFGADAERASKAKFGKPFADLTPAEAVEVNKVLFEQAKATAPTTTVKLPPQQSSEQSKRGELLVADYKAIADTARVGQKTLPALESNLSILDKGFDTGFGTATQAVAARVLGALGVQNAKDFATNADVFLANASSAVLQKQLEQKGPQTEADAQRITQTGAQLGNTKEANKFLLTVAREQIRRDVEQAEFYRKWYTKNKTYDGAEDAWLSGEGGKSLFERPALRSYSSPAASARVRQGDGTPSAAPAPAGNIDALLRKYQ